MNGEWEVEFDDYWRKPSEARFVVGRDARTGGWEDLSPVEARERAAKYWPDRLLGRVRKVGAW